ncbi:hypothetical protein [uncultured Tateyamaria sp.]|uniref:hypothetical protein n=1 Tax=uncultured Tateyamaria sp. TaxID=455651 RepID=UPI0026110292|nr:hypothetical protein [uncultured Tateyamaria sp.]
MNQLTDQIRAAVLDADGSCRDVNFVGVEHVCINEVYKYFDEHFKTIKVFDQDGNDVAFDQLSEPACSTSSALLILLQSGRAVFGQAQCYVEWMDDGSADVEFTFFPEDVSDVTGVLSFLYDLKRELRATRFWVRYEDAQWTPETECELSSVIFDSAETLT